MDFFVFIHIEKAAGSTLHNLIKYHIPNYFVLYPWWYWSNEKGAFVTAEELRLIKRLYPFLKGVGGHTVRTYAGYEKAVKGKINYFTFLREPVKRYLSHFYYQNNKMGFRRSLDDFLGEPRFNNYMTVRLAGSEDVEKAKTVLKEKFRFVGLTEHFNESLLLLVNRVFGDKFIPYYQSFNVTRERHVSFDELTAGQKEKVLANNRLDLELFRFAKEEVYPAQIENCSFDLEQRLREFESANATYKYNPLRFKSTYLLRGLSRYLVEPLAHKLT